MAGDAAEEKSTERLGVVAAATKLVGPNQIDRTDFQAPGLDKLAPASLMAGTKSEIM
jgi:hypothetical protein